MAACHPTRSRIARRLQRGALLFVLVLPGCAERGRLTTVDLHDAAPIAGETREDMLVATSRAPSTTPGEDFSRARGSQVSFRNYVIRLPPNHVAGEVEWASGRKGGAAGFVSAADTSLRTAGDFAQRLHGLMAALPPERRAIVVFVHGYNTNFAEGLYQFAQFKKDAGIPAVSIFYSWPSGGREVDYVYDRDSATFARDGLEQVLKLAAGSGAREVFILAHSMGTWLTMETLRQARIGGDHAVLDKIGGVALVEPDIDFDVFRAQVERAKPLPARFAVLVSQNDVALRLSKRLAGDAPRVGSGENADALRAMGIEVIDVSAIKDGEALHHATFATSATFLARVSQQMQKDGGLLVGHDPAKEANLDGLGGDGQGFVLKIGLPTATP